MPDEPDRPRPLRPECSLCGKAIGAHERVWAHLPDGTMHAAALLNLAESTRGNAVKIWHLAC